jgi:RNA polymerase sigma-70 factor (ECF subfamily)
MQHAPDARITDAWNDHRAFLLDVGYRLLGSYTEAEDIVQEAFTRLLRSDLDPIEDVRAWLVVVVSRLCLDQLRSARVKREAYLGPWFPEPIVDGELGEDPAAIVTMDESVRMALLIVLERMSPAERVVFVLHDVFEFSFEKIASMVNRTPAACRQLASRARRRVKEEAGGARFVVDPKEQRRIVEAFVAACTTGDVERLLPLLDQSVMGWADIGGILPTVSQPNLGPQQVGSSLMRFFGPAAGVRLIARWVNGEPGVIAISKEGVRAVLALSTKDGLITRVYAVADPRKLTRLPSDLIR